MCALWRLSPESDCYRNRTHRNRTGNYYEYDPVSRLSELTSDFPSASSDQSTTFSYNPASQIAGLTRSNDAWAWTGPSAGSGGSGTTGYTANGLNQYGQIDGATATYDARGNMTFDPQSGRTFAYNAENMLTSVSGQGAMVQPARCASVTARSF